ncbi:MAG: hypothetical protein ACP5RJ_08440 [Conexivisphaera sp.]
MPEGMLKTRTILIEPLTTTGNEIVYESFTGGTLSGQTGAIVYGNLDIIDAAYIVGNLSGYVNAQVIGVGLGVGSITGSVTGSHPAASNIIVFKTRYPQGVSGSITVNLVEPAPGTAITGSVDVLEVGR